MDPRTITVQRWRAVGWLGVAALCVTSLMPPPSLLTAGPLYSDKFYHLAAYAGLMWWLALGYASRQWKFLGAGLVLLGIALEILQDLTPSRVPSGWDEFANTLGVLLGYWLARQMPAGFPAFRRAK